MPTDFKQLDIWRVAMELAKVIHLLTRSFPKEEIYGMTSQIRRSSSSVAVNIAEGSGRGSPREFIQFLNIAQGSLRETETHLLLAIELGYLPRPKQQPAVRPEPAGPVTVESALSLIERTYRLITAMRQSQEQKLSTERR
jgi:four helix bundle protein